MNFLLKFFKYLSILSLIFQRNDTTPDSLPKHIQSTKQKLVRLKDCTKLNEILGNDVESKDGSLFYHNRELDKPIGGTAQLRSTTVVREAAVRSNVNHTQVKNLAETVITKAIAHIDQRFQTVLQADIEGIMDSFSVFDPAILPSKEDELEEYGNDSVESLFLHFKSLMKGTALEEIHSEWSILKVFMFRKRISSVSIHYADFWSEIIKSKKPEIPKILILVQAGLVLPIHSAEPD